MLPQYRHIGNLKQRRDMERLSYRAPFGNGKMNGSGTDYLGEFKASG
jgi:3-dehydroquinate dehydratase